MKTQWELMEEWLEGKPPIVRELYVEYPPNKPVLKDGQKVWVIAYADDGGLSVTPVNPYEDYDGAIAAKMEICPCCVKKLIKT